MTSGCLHEVVGKIAGGRQNYFPHIPTKTAPRFTTSTIQENPEPTLDQPSSTGLLSDIDMNF